jgi:serine/threonine-protein kinase RsbW
VNVSLEPEHYRPVVVELHRRVPATADRLPTLRRELSNWAEGAGLGAGDLEGLVLACYEAMANVVEHAYSGEIGVLDLRAAGAPEDGGLTVTITDYGQWRPPSGKPSLLRGRGLPLIRTMPATTVIVPTPQGTTVRMHWRLPTTGAARRHVPVPIHQEAEPLEQAARL